MTTTCNQKRNTCIERYKQFKLSVHLSSKDTCEKYDGVKALLISANEDERRITEEEKKQHLLKDEIA